MKGSQAVKTHDRLSGCRDQTPFPLQVQSLWTESMQSLSFISWS